MLRRTLFIFCAFVSVSAFSQQVNVNEFFKNLKPRAIGPAGMSGRITAIDAIADRPNTVYLGAASGGVWKTENGGMNWSPVFDEQPTLNVGSIAIQQSNPSIVWVGTGEGNPRNSLNIGDGIFKTMDGGKSWTCMGLEKTKNIHRILVDPTNPAIVYAGAIGNPFVSHPERGVFKTSDGGLTWQKILYTNDSSGVADMIMDPSNPNKLFAAMWQHRRTPWSMTSGGKGSGLYRTVDGGKNWVKLGKDDGLPEGDYGRIGLTISKSNPNRVYALIEATKNGLYRSDDGGYKWQLINSDPQWVTNRPFYFQDVRVDPENENRLWLIYQMISVSEDGGKTFSTVIPYSGIHPDHHAFYINPLNGSHIIDGNDGGIGVSRDRGKSWQFDEKIPVGQFYHINVDNELPYHVMGGMQDNGSWRGPAYTWTEGGIRNYYWDNLWGGDGFDVMPDQDDANWVFAMSQEGEIGRYHIPTGERSFIKPPAPDLKTTLRFNWNSALAQDPMDHNTIYFASQFLYKSTNKGASWETISPDLTTNDSAKIDQSNNGGLSLDITGAENYCTILTIAPSSKDRNVIWVGTDDGNVQLTRNGGKSWTNFRTLIPGLPAGAWIPQIVASRYNAGEAFVVANDYRRGDFRPYIFRTTDFGKTWIRMIDDKKVRGYALSVLQDPVQPNLIFAGTEHGLWVSFDNGTSFQQWKNGLPSVSTYDMAIQEREADLVIATFGRAIYVLDDIRPLRALAADKGIVKKKFKVFEAPEAYLASYKNAPGYEWSTWGTWDAPNRDRDARLSFYNNFAGYTDSLKRKQDTVTVSIYNEKLERIRELKIKADTGFNRISWNMDEKGFRNPGSSKPLPSSPEPGGWRVLPGTFKIIMFNGTDRDSTVVTVKPDPRLGDRTEITRAQRALLLRLRKQADRLTEGMDQLTEAEATIGKIQAQLKGMEGKTFDSLGKSATRALDSIKSIREFISGKPRPRQGYGAVPTITVMNQFYEANSSITSKAIVPGAAEEKEVRESEELIEQAVQQINRFFTGEWKKLRTQVEQTPIPLFKEYKPL